MDTLAADVTVGQVADAFAAHAATRALMPPTPVVDKLSALSSTTSKMRHLNGAAPVRLVAIHGIDGDPQHQIFAALARNLNGAVELHAIRSTVETREECTSVEEVARCYVALLMTRWPAAHRHNILGHSFGAIVAQCAAAQPHLTSLFTRMPP